MKTNIYVWLGLVIALSLITAACGGTTPTAETEEPTIVESVGTKALPTTPIVESEEPKPTMSVVTEDPLAESIVTDEPKTTGPRTGEIAPDFTLPDSNGDMVHLADELNDNRIVILVFYHAHF